MKYSLVIILLLFYTGASSGQVSYKSWPLFRGTPDLSGKSEFELPASPVLQWSTSTGERTKSSPVIDNGTIYFGSEEGTLYAVTTDGTIVWKFSMTGALDAPPLVYGKNVIIGGSDGILRAIDKMTGKLTWEYKTENQIAGSANYWTNGKKAGILVGSYDYYLHCVAPETGKLLWKAETDNYVNGTPAVGGNRIIFGGCDGIIRVADPLTGKQKDTVNIGVYIAGSPSIAGDNSYFGDYDGTLYSLNMLSKKITWKIPPGDQTGSILAIPATANNVVVVGNEDKYLYCYNSADGKLLWKFRTNGRINGSAVITSDKVLFTSMDGNVYILALNDGKKLWSFNAGSPVSSSPAVIKDRFYILTEDGRLLSFGVRK